VRKRFEPLARSDFLLQPFLFGRRAPPLFWRHFRNQLDGNPRLGSLPCQCWLFCILQPIKVAFCNEKCRPIVSKKQKNAMSELTFRKSCKTLYHKDIFDQICFKRGDWFACSSNKLYVRSHQVLYIFLDFHFDPTGIAKSVTFIWIAESFLSWRVHWINNVPDQQGIYGCFCHWACASMPNVKISTAFANIENAVDLILNCMRVDWRNGIFVVFRSKQFKRFTVQRLVTVLLVFTKTPGF